VHSLYLLLLCLLQSLKEKLKDLQTRLDRSFKRQDEAKKMKDQPIMYTQQFLALDDKETSKFMEIFMAIDKNR